MADTLVFFALEILEEEIAKLLNKALPQNVRAKDQATEKAESSTKSIQAESSTESKSGNLTEIGNSLRTMQCFLNYANGRVDEHGNIPKFVAEIADIAYQIIHALVSYRSQVQAPDNKGTKNLLTRFPCIPYKGLNNNKFDSEIEAIKEKTTSLTERLNLHEKLRTTKKDGKRWVESKKYENLWKHRDSVSTMDQQLLTRDHPHLINEDPIEMDTDGEQLLEFLTNNNKDTFITIIGEEGSGKTAIAKKIYKCVEIMGGFERMAWGRIKGDLEEAFRDILTELLPKMKDEILRMEFKEVRDHIIRVLKERKCLVVIDQVESDVLMNAIHQFFDETDGSSKIMITSRNVKVGHVHELKHLGEDESKNLFQKVASAPNIVYTDEAEDFWSKLVKACNGSRLAIVTVGGYVRRAYEINDIQSLRRLHSLKEFTLDNVLRHLYIEIPYDLRACLRYLGNFTHIPIEKLFLLWIAENLLPPNPEFNTIAVAKQYLFELAKRNLVHLIIDEHTGQFKSCRVNDLIRNICLEKHSIDDCIQYSKIQEEEATTTSNHDYINKSRLSISLDDLDCYLPYSRKISPDLVSALIFPRNSERPRISRTLQSCITDLKLVRVLDLGGLIISKLDKVIGNLIHLKYLGLRNSLFPELPSTIQNMSNLQTLDLRDDDTQFGSILVPNILLKLNRLRYLFLRRIAVSGAKKEKLQLTGLVNLQILENFDPEQFDVNDLINLPNLRILKVNINSMASVSQIIPCIPNHRRFRELTLSITNCNFYTPEGRILLTAIIRCEVLSNLSLNGRIGMFDGFNPTYRKSLTELTLESCELVENSISILEEFPSLQVLSLKWNAFLGEKMVFKAHGFPKLRFLQLSCLNSLKDWVVSQGAMPNVSSIHIISCPNLEKIPDGLQSVSTLKLLLIKWMPKSFTDRLSNTNTVHGNKHASLQIINHRGETARKRPEVTTEASNSPPPIGEQ